MLEQALLSCGAGGRAPCPRSCLLSAIVRHIKAGRGLPIFVAVGCGGVVDGHIVDGPLPELLHGIVCRTCHKTMCQELETYYIISYQSKWQQCPQ